METSSFDIKSYIKKALETKNTKISEITLTGTIEKSDGYGSDINFARVLATTDEGVEKDFELAIKSSKMKSVKDINRAFQREIYFYNFILPELSRFQKQSNIENIFNSIPKCYKIICDEKADVIVMENLKSRGYRLYDSKKPLDLNHVKLVLREYGKFHAISFAFRNNRKEDFEKLVTNYEDIFLSFVTGYFGKTFQQRMEITCEILKNINETELYEMCYNISEKGAVVAFSDILKTVEPDSAILHGDCWNNNFIYKYESEDPRLPTKVSILDWQISRIHSPVLDLSYFIYSTCSEEQLKHFEELLSTYYTSFSTFLTDLGCVPEILFPYSALLDHWKKYSLFGVLIVINFLHVITCDKEDAPNDYKDGEDFAEKILNMKVKDAPEYQKRLVAVIRHYYKVIYES